MPLMLSINNYYIPSVYLFSPVVIESTGVLGPDTRTFLKDIGKRVQTVTGNPMSIFFREFRSRYSVEMLLVSQEQWDSKDEALSIKDLRSAGTRDKGARMMKSQSANYNKNKSRDNDRSGIKIQPCKNFILVKIKMKYFLHNLNFE